MSTDKNSGGKQLIGWLMLFVGLLLIVSLTKGVFEMLSVYDRVELAEQEAAELEAKKVSLERQLQERSSDGFVERQIRNKLHLSRPGEIVVVLPEERLRIKKDMKVEMEVDERENWQKWLDLFL